jgi:hypothetical protein
MRNGVHLPDMSLDIVIVFPRLVYLPAFPTRPTEWYNSTSTDIHATRHTTWQREYFLTTFANLDYN